MTEPWSITRLDEVEALPAEHGLQVRLLRRALGIESFGINAYLAAAVGDVVIEEHDELGRGAGRHEELYVVLRGRASFTVAGEQVDAPTGTLVVVRDPATRRGAIAADADTAVLVVAGVPGQPYRPAAWEHWFARSDRRMGRRLPRRRRLSANWVRLPLEASFGLSPHLPEQPSTHRVLSCGRGRLS